MKTKPLTATQIDALAQRLSETPVEPSTSARRAGDNLARLLVAQIGAERATLAFTSIMTATTDEQAEARLTLVLDYGNTEPAGEAIHPYTCGRDNARARSFRRRTRHKALL